MIFIILIAVTGIPVVQHGQGMDIVRLSQLSGKIVSYLAISAQEVGKSTQTGEKNWLKVPLSIV